MFHSRKGIILFLLLAVCCTSCQKKKWTVVQHSSTKIAIDSITETIACKEYKAFLQPYKEQMNAEMQVIIGQSEQTMTAHRPESLLGNFSADIYRQKASEYLNQTVDIGIANIGGLRVEISKGDITVGRLFEIFPFENELVILWLKGNKILELLDVIAALGGEGISGLKMGIRDGKAVNPTIGGKAIDVHKTYTIATNDFLAGGNDHLIQLAEHEKQVDTGIKIRNLFIDYVKEETKKGNKIKSQLDGRIYEIK